MPMMNVVNGGKHATNSADFQEYMIIPLKAQNFRQAIRIGAEVFMSLKKVIQEAGVSTAVGDEGGFTYPCTSNTEPLDILTDAVKRAGYEPGVDIRFAMDVAASEFYVDGKYELKTENRTLSTEEMNAYLEQITHRYPIASIEDGLSEDDWDGWAAQTTTLSQVQLVGDDLLVTNIERLQKAIDTQVGNAILIKPNQIGTLSETITAIRLAKQHGWRTIVSHRSGETEDVTIAHLAIGTGADQIKTGSMSRSESTAKYNELMRLEEIDEALRLAQPFAND
jgi:enolase